MSASRSAVPSRADSVDILYFTWYTASTLSMARRPTDATREALCAPDYRVAGTIRMAASLEVCELQDRPTVAPVDRGSNFKCSASRALSLYPG